jgi:hypothetical protein
MSLFSSYVILAAGLMLVAMLLRFAWLLYRGPQSWRHTDP